MASDGKAICRQRSASHHATPGLDDIALHQNPFQLTWQTPAVQHMATYWAILEKKRGSGLRLTKMDDEIYEHFRKEFPEFDPRETIDENKMKSKEGKEKWRSFMMAYDKTVEDYNFGTMLRSNPKFEYGEKETIFGLRSATSWTASMLTLLF